MDQVLLDTLSADNATRQNATQQLEAACNSDFPVYLHTLATSMGNEESPSHVRNAAGLAFKNALSGRESSLQQTLTTRYLSLPPTTRQSIKSLLLPILASPDKRSASVAAQCIAAIAAIELPVGEWGELIGQLLGFATGEGGGGEGLRVATLQCVGYICEVIKPEILATRSNEILTAVVQGARKEETSQDVQYAAITALLNSLEFIKDNFEREGERNYIMQVVCEATQSPSILVQAGAFECLVRIMGLYYDKMGLYMERALFGLTVLGMQNEEEKVALQAVEFWSTVCDEELELAIEAAEAAEFGEAPDQESKHFARTALPEILPVMLNLLLKQDEDAEDDEWNVAMAAATCVALLAGVVADAIVQPTIPFIEAHIKAADWREREAAVMAFGSILDGPDSDKLTPLVQQALPTLIGMMRDESSAVKDTVSWTLGRITELMIESISLEVHLPELINSLVHGLSQEGRVAAYSAWAIKNLAQQLGAGPLGDGVEATTALSQYYQGLLSTLMNSTQARTDNEGNARTAAYEAIADLALYSAQDTLEMVSQLGVQILSKMEELLALHNQLVGSDDRANWNELQGNCCNVLSNVIRRLGDLIAPIADRIMNILLQLLQSSSKDAAVAEDAFMTIGSLVNVSGPAFDKYVQHLLEFLYPALTNFAEYSVFLSAVGLTGDLARAISTKILPFTENLLQALLNALASPALHRSCKPAVVSAIGDIAQAVEQQFTPFLEHVMGMLSQAGSVQVDVNSDASMQDFVWTMRESIAEAFIGILAGYHSDPTPFTPYVNGVIKFVVTCVTDEDETEAFVKNGMNLLGDLATAFRGTATASEFMTDGISTILQLSRSRGYGKSAQNAIKYARKAVKDATASLQ